MGNLNFLLLLFLVGRCPTSVWSVRRSIAPIMTPSRHNERTNGERGWKVLVALLVFTEKRSFSLLRKISSGRSAIYVSASLNQCPLPDLAHQTEGNYPPESLRERKKMHLLLPPPLQGSNPQRDVFRSGSFPLTARDSKSFGRAANPYSFLVVVCGARAARSPPPPPPLPWLPPFLPSSSGKLRQDD